MLVGGFATSGIIHPLCGCECHGLVQGGNNTELKARLKAHYDTCAHPHKPGGAASDKAATYYDTGFDQKKKQDLHTFWSSTAKEL